MQRIVIFGGTGFIGQSFARHIKAQGYHPILVARNKIPGLDFDFVAWDAHSLGDWVNTLEGAHAIVNLTGKTVDCIKTPDNCDLILRSRVDSTLAIGKAFEQLENPPKIWIQMSTAHIYGDPPTQLCTEGSSYGYGLAPTVGKAWEEAFFQALPEDVRGVRIRTSFVIGKNGGALGQLKKITRMGLGGKTGHGNQGISWIHEYDMNEIMLQAILNENYNDYYIASAPNPVSNRAFMKQLRKQMKVPFGIPSPEWITRLGANLIFRTDPELLLYGRYVKSIRLEEIGYQFKFPDLESALRDLV